MFHVLINFLYKTFFLKICVQKHFSWQKWHKINVSKSMLSFSVEVNSLSMPCWISKFWMKSATRIPRHRYLLVQLSMKCKIYDYTRYSDIVSADSPLLCISLPGFILHLSGYTYDVENWGGKYRGGFKGVGIEKRESGSHILTLTCF